MTALSKLIALLLPLLLVSKIDYSKTWKIQSPVPSSEIKISASSESRGLEAIFAINGSGMNHHFHQSDRLGKNMWLSEVSEKTVQARPGTRKGSVWLLAEFDKVRKIESLDIWNYNQDNFLNRGLKKVYFQYSNNGNRLADLEKWPERFFHPSQSSGTETRTVKF